MKYLLAISLLAVAMAPLGAAAQSTDSAIKKDPGYESGSSDSGKSGMDSSRGTPTSPTAGRPGTVDNGNPFAKSTHHKKSKHHRKHHHSH